MRVVVNRGKVSCKTAGEVMRKLFRKGPDPTIGKWDCIGPQTGFAQCDYGNRRITGHFQKVHQPLTASATGSFLLDECDRVLRGRLGGPSRYRVREVTAALEAAGLRE